MNFSVPFLPPLQLFGLNCLKCFLSQFLKWTISASRLLFLTSILTAIPLRGRKPPEGSGLLMIGRRIKLFNFWSEFTADFALMISWGSFQPEWFSEMAIHVLRGEAPSHWAACLQGGSYFTTHLQSHPGINQKCACRSLRTESTGRGTAA